MISDTIGAGDQQPSIATLLASRKDSKYLAKFLASYVERTANRDLTPMLVMMSDFDTWNDEIARLFQQYGIKFFRESRGLGRNGLHMYYEDLASKVEADWYIYFCEDHHIVAKHWDDVIRQEINMRDLDPDQPYILVPHWDNIGAMNHVVSRGYLKALGGRFASHGNLDSYINFVAALLPGTQVIQLPVLFHDFTHDVPSMMDESRTKVELSEEGKALPVWESKFVKDQIERDAKTIKDIIKARVR